MIAVAIVIVWGDNCKTIFSTNLRIKQLVNSKIIIILEYYQ